MPGRVLGARYIAANRIKYLLSWSSQASGMNETVGKKIFLSVLFDKMMYEEK